MSIRHQLFVQLPHPAEVNDFFHVLNIANILNVVYWNEYFRIVQDVTGDIVEFGIGRGRSLLTIMGIETMFRTFDGYNPRKIHALDSFEGFPEPTAEDTSPRAPRKGEWSQSPNGQFQYSIANLREIIEKAGIPHSIHKELVLIKGFFDQTAHQVSTESIAILHLDGDLYASIKAPLSILANKVARGGVIVIDDYLMNDSHQESEPFPGARLAVDEFLQSRNDFEQRVSMRGTPYLLRTTA